VVIMRRLLALLAAVTVVLLATARWRQRLLHEAAHYHDLSAAVSRSRTERAGREEEGRRLEAAVAAHPDDLDARFKLAQLRWSTRGPVSAIPVLERWPSS